MRRKVYIGMGLLFILVINENCKKSESDEDCFPNSATIRQIVNQFATVKITPGSAPYLVEDGALDTRLIPCNLTREFQQNDLHVLVSGDVKGATTMGPCCSENFVITAITR